MSIIETITKITEDNREKIIDTLNFITKNPEIGGEEYKASKYLTGLLSENGFDIKKNFEGEETAFVAEYKNGDGPKIAFLAKYDALPNFDENNSHAHGCGHNWVAAWAVGCGIVLSKLTEHFSGTVSVVGSPPEEFFGKDIPSLKSDYFKECDVIFSTHLSEENLLHSFARAITAIEFKFIGLGRQAFSWPEEGKNSADTMNKTLSKIIEYRENSQLDDRINYIVANAGHSITEVPHTSLVRIGIGGVNKDRTDELTREIIQIAQKVSKEDEIEFEYKIYNTFVENDNIPLIHEVVMSSFEDFEEEYDILPKKLGRTQLDNAFISKIAPMIYMFFGVPGFTSHQPGINRIAASCSDKAKQNLLTGVGIFTDTAIKLFNDQEYVKAIKSAFDDKKFYRYGDDYNFIPYNKKVELLNDRTSYNN